MAKKSSGSILNRLRKLLPHRAPEKASTRREAAKGAERQSAPSAVNRTAESKSTPEAPEEKQVKKKTPGQPWYHHRQRW